MWAKNKQQLGFTIVELLIVIVIIGILAAITIVSYTGISQRAIVSSLQSDLTNAANQLKLDQVTSSSYPATLALANGGKGIPASAGTTYQYSVNNTVYPPTFCITATNGTTSYKISNDGSTSLGGCPGHGVGGVAAITNYALDPNAAGTGSAFGYAGAPVAATRLIASDRSHDGTTSLKTIITGASGQTGAQAQVPPGGMRVNNGETVSWSFWVYSTRAGSLIPYMDGSKVSDGTYTGASSASAVSFPANTWTKVTGSFTATIDLYVGQIGGYNLAVVSGDIVWFDSFMVEKSTTFDNYADGNSPNWVWNGQPNNSTSTGPAL